MIKRRHFLGTAAVTAATAGLTACGADQGAKAGQSNSVGTAGATQSHLAANVKIPEGVEGNIVFSAAEYERRYDGIRKQMQAQNIDALIVTGTREWHNGDLGNLQYLGVPIDWDTTYVIVPIDKEPIVLNKIPGFPAFKELGPGGPPVIPSKHEGVPVSTVMSMPKEGARFVGDHAPTLVKQIEELGLSSGRIGIVAMRNLRADVYRTLIEGLPNAAFVDAERILLRMRYYKSAEEIAFLKRSGYVADMGMAAAIEASVEGAHDIDIHYAADIACAKAGGPVGGFQLIGSGQWGGKMSSLLLSSDGGRTLNKGDMVNPEIGSNYKGYWTQLGVPISLGEPPDAYYEVLELCDKVYSFIDSEFRPGKTVWAVDDACKEFTKDVSDGAYTTLFGIQAGEHELTFAHDNYELRPGALAYNQPFFLPLSKPGMPFHVYGDAMVMTEGEPIKLHQTKMGLVVV
ncbi:MAG: M24 family metallopeptidase [Pseudomonadota bacterium]